MELIIRTVIETIYLTGIIILVGFILGIFRNKAIRNFQRSFGFKSVMVTGFIGVPVHELSHAIIAIIFGHKITKIKLLQRPDEGGVLGYVNHSYNKNNIYQQIGNFFIGIAPIFGGSLCIILAMKFLLPAAYNDFFSIVIRNYHTASIDKSVVYNIADSYLQLIRVIFSVSNFAKPYFYIFLFLSICIASHISLSTADIKGAFSGLLTIFIILFILNLLGLSKYVLAITIVRYNILITSFLFISLLLSFITFIISILAITLIK